MYYQFKFPPKLDRSHVVQAGSHLSPGKPYRVLVTLFETSKRSGHLNEYIHGTLPASVDVRVLRDGSVVSEEARECFPDSTVSIALKVGCRCNACFDLWPLNCEITLSCRLHDRRGGKITCLPSLSGKHGEKAE